jgi:hypothetical protein
MIFVWLGMLILHVTHVDVHQSRAGKEVLRLSRDHYDPTVRVFLSYGPGRRDSGNTISDNGYVHPGEFYGKIINILSPKLPVNIISSCHYVDKEVKKEKSLII